MIFDERDIDDLEQNDEIIPSSNQMSLDEFMKEKKEENLVKKSSKSLKKSEAKTENNNKKEKKDKAKSVSVSKVEKKSILFY